MSAAAKPILVEISPGELLDKITVLRIKTRRIGDPAKLAHIRADLALLEKAYREAVEPSRELDGLIGGLEAVNGELYDMIDAIYACERAGEPPERFVALARSVYRFNDRRALLKRKINLLLGSRLVEEKGHAIGT